MDLELLRSLIHPCELVAAIDQLARIVSQYDLSEIEISLGDLQVRLGRERGHGLRKRSRDS